MARDEGMGDIKELMMPMKTDRGLRRPVFTQNGALLSLRLAQTAYSLQMGPWRDAGWKDVSYHIDHTLLTGEEANGASGGIGGVFSEYKQFMARFRARSTNLLGQVLGTVRNREESDTCKAVVMIKRQEGNRYLVAIGFMGTGKRVYDWMANFRLANEEGMHRGCLQLTRNFEERLEELVFLETARELGLEKLTLQDILQECKRPDSRFKIWMAGHSQGGAVMQLFAYRALQNGVLRENMIGYGFASPSVMYGPGKMNLAGVPLLHICNGDDLTPRVGARLHIGQLALYHPEDEMRNACYATAWQNVRREMALLACLRNTEGLMLFVMALCRALQELSDEATVLAFSELAGRFMPEKMRGMLGGRMDEGVRTLEKYVKRQYYSTTGKHSLPEGWLKTLKGRIAQEMQQSSPRQFIRNVLRAMAEPHRLQEKNEHENGWASYAYITEKGWETLKTVITLEHPAIKADRQQLHRKRRKWPTRFGYAKRRNSGAVHRHNVPQ